MSDSGLNIPINTATLIFSDIKGSTQGDETIWYALANN